MKSKSRIQIIKAILSDLRVIKSIDFLFLLLPSHREGLGAKKEEVDTSSVFITTRDHSQTRSDPLNCLKLYDTNLISGEGLSMGRTPVISGKFLLFDHLNEEILNMQCSMLNFQVNNQL
jgi:hypothetical protein